jgi:glycosyltransferase involved in cell wall biosynthesis
VEFTILMPCLNEAETVSICVKKAVAYLDDNGIDGEVLVADNGSDDGSQQLARDAGARVLDVEMRGYGAALIAGIADARGEYVIMADADDSYDFSALGPFVDGLRGGADLVMGNRFKGGIKPGAMPALHRYLGNPVLSGVGRVFFRSKIGDFHCGLRGFRRDKIAALDLQSPGMEFASEMVVKATLEDLVITEVPTVLHPDGRSRAPHLRSWSDGWRHLRFLMLYSPRWLFFYPGILLVAIGFAVGLRLTIGPWHLGSVTLDTNSLDLCSASIFIGYESAWFGVLSKSFASREGLLPHDVRVERFLRRFPLERALLLSLAMAVIGIVGLTLALARWNAVGFGDLNTQSSLRVVVPSATLVVVAAETALSSLLLSILTLPRGAPRERAGVEEPA